MSLLGLLNFAFLQWFGIRLVIVVKVPYRDRNASSTAGALRVAIAGSHRWCLLYWVCPLTGWWNDFGWIARRPIASADQLGAVALATLMAGSGLGLALLCAVGAP